MYGKRASMEPALTAKTQAASLGGEAYLNAMSSGARRIQYRLPDGA